MNRYSVREAPRAILQHELADHIRGEEHLHPEQPERADALRRALQDLEMGAPVTRAMETQYRINEELQRSYGVSEGTREELMAEIQRLHADRWRQNRPDKLTVLDEAMVDLGKGAAEVRVRFVLYRVVEDDED